MTIPKKITLTTRWCLLRSELVLGFPSASLALRYQSLHPEGRIFTKRAADGGASNEKEVFLPHPKGLVGVRTSSQGPGTFGLVLDFESKGAVEEWTRGKGGWSQVFEERKCSVYLLREVGGEGVLGKDVGKGMAGLGLGNNRTPELYIQDPKNPKKFIHYDPSRDRRDRQRQT